jgi:hypothetical protein
MTAINESELDSVYGELCRAISEVGEAHAPLLLARFALLAIGEIGDVEQVRRILTCARDCEAGAVVVGQDGLTL